MIPQPCQNDNTNHHKNHDGYDPISLSEDFYFDPSDEEDFSSQSEVSSQLCTNVPITQNKDIKEIDRHCRDIPRFDGLHAGATTSRNGIQSSGNCSTALPKEGCVGSVGATDVGLTADGETQPCVPRDGSVGAPSSGWERMVYDLADAAPDCQSVVSLDLVDSQSPKKGIVVDAQCKSWSCSACGPRKRLDWFCHLRDKMALSAQHLSFAKSGQEKWDAAKKRLNRQVAHYVRVKSKDGYILICTGVVAKSQPISFQAALEELAKALLETEFLIDPKSVNRPVITSRGEWELPSHASKYVRRNNFKDMEEAENKLRPRHVVNRRTDRNGETILAYERNAVVENAAKGMVELTDTIIDKAKSRNGSWSKKQLALIGVAWPPAKHWRIDMVGKFFPKENMEAFVALKDVHIKGNEEQCDANGDDGCGN